MNRWLAVCAASLALFVFAVSADAQTAIQFGVIRTDSPPQVCAFDGTNTCQPFMLLPNGGPAVIPSTSGGSGISSPTAHSLMIGDGASPFNLLGAATGGRMLLDQGASTDPAYEAMSGDATLATSGALTLGTVNSNVGSFGSSTAIPYLTVNAKGLVTAAGTNVVIAPAGTLTGTTLAPNVVTSSLTAIGTIATGVWQGTPVAVTYGGTGHTSAGAATANAIGALAEASNLSDVASRSTAFNNLAPTPTRAGDVLYWTGSAWASLAGNNSGTQYLSESSGGTPAWAAAGAGGSNTQLQFNNSGAFSGVSGATSDGTNIIIGNTNLRVDGTSTGYTTVTSANSSSSNYTITLPATTGTVALTSQLIPVGGSTSYVQFNSGGVLAADQYFKYAGSGGAVSVNENFNFLSGTAVFQANGTAFADFNSTNSGDLTLDVDTIANDKKILIAGGEFQLTNAAISANYVLWFPATAMHYNNSIPICWSAGDAANSCTVSISQDSTSGVLDVGNGNAGDYSTTVKTGKFIATAAAPTVASAQIGYGSTTTANTSCGTLASSAGCIVVNIGGTVHYIPYY